MSQIAASSRRPTRSWLGRLGTSLRSYFISGLSLKDPALKQYFMDGPPSYAGIPVNETNAFTYSAVFDAVNQISSDIAKLPLDLRKRVKSGGSDAYTGSKLYNLLKYEPNPEMGSMVFRRTVTAHALTAGGGYAEIERDGLGRPSALWPITPDRIKPFRDRTASGYGPLRYLVDGKTILEGPDVIHIHGLGYDGYVGYNVINQARQAIGLGLAAEKFGAEFFGTGAAMPGILSSDIPYDEETEGAIQKSIAAKQSAAGRARQMMLLFGGEWKFEKTGITPAESQMNDLRDEQVAEVARFFNMPVHKLKNLDRATNNNIEQQDLEYYKGCLLNWITLWEEELNRKLISPLERTMQYVKFNANGFLRGDNAGRAALYSAFLDRGVYCADDVLDLEDMNPQPNGLGKVLLVQGAMVPKEQLVNLVQSQIDKNNAPPPPPPASPKDPNAPEPPAGPEQKNSLQERLELAELLAKEARAEAQTERDLRVAAEASGMARAEEIERLRSTEQAADVRATTFEVQVAERQRELEAERAAHQAVAEQLVEIERLKAEAVQKAIEADERAMVAEAARLLASHDAEDAAERARMAAELAAEAQKAAESARQALTLSDGQRAEAERLSADAKAAAEAAELARVEMVSLAEAAAEAERAARKEAERSTAHAVELSASLDREAVARAAVEQRAADLRIAVDMAEERHAQAIREAEAVAATLADTAAAKDAAEAERRQREEGMAAVIAAHHALVLDTMRRMVERETDRARRAQISPDKLRRWLETFYEGHEDLLRTALLPAVRVHLAFVRADEDPVEMTRRLAAAHVDESRRQILTVLDGDADDLAASLPGLLHRWDTERPSTIANLLMQRELDHHARRR